MSLKSKGILIIVITLLIQLFFIGKVFAQTVPTPTPEYELCKGGGCPSGGPNYVCAPTLNDWYQNKHTNFWVNDEEVTALGKGGERSRQFLFWALTHSSIDNNQAILTIWSLARNVTYFLLFIVAAVMGLGLIISQRNNFNVKIEIVPLLLKIGGVFLYATFSAFIVLTIIQLSDTLMLFFTEQLGVKQLFNIFFLQNGTQNVIKDSETAYQTFQGCRNLNVSLGDSVNTSKFLINVTNLTYYALGIMLLLRKILLWFLLFVSPFLALLIPFTFIRNIGWIWIGVFFQWVFYGPLFALFLGGLAKIWNSPTHIPYNFDFSRVGSSAGIIYPTSINILYGGPAQVLSFLNSSNYIDTFAEYIIALLMLWAVTFFPWWLLRIFRDYCCEGIYAMKNILLSMYDQSRGGQPPKPPIPSPTPTSLGIALKIPTISTIPISVKLETIEQIKQTKTEDISRSLNLSVSRLTDIARIETNKTLHETVNKNINYLQNPIQAQTPTERQRFMNIRTELFSRAVHEDTAAKHILSTLSTSQMEQVAKRQEIVKDLPHLVPVTRIVAIKVKLPQEKVNSVSSTYVQSMAQNQQFINTLSQTTHLPPQTVQTILTSYGQNINQPATQMLKTISSQTKVSPKQVTQVVGDTMAQAKTAKAVVAEVAQKENLREIDVEHIVEEQAPVVAEPEKHIEQMVAIPPSISLEDYEQVKRMWQDQYERGEVPVTETIKTREQWIDDDIVFITNTLNKILSADEKLRQDGLDEVGYILPIFLINNLKGEELVVYLKAKLEAAKAVADQKQKEKELTEKLKPKEEFVDVTKQKTQEAEKTMEMKEELKQDLPKEEPKQ